MQITMIWKISLLYARRPSVGFGPSWIPAARSFSHSKSSATWVAAIRHPLRSATAHQSWCVLFRAVQPTAPDCQEVCDAGQGLCIEKSSRLLPFKSHFHFPLSYTECERLQNMWRENKRPKRLQNMCWERFCWKQVGLQNRTWKRGNMLSTSMGRFPKCSMILKDLRWTLERLNWPSGS